MSLMIRNARILNPIELVTGQFEIQKGEKIALLGPSGAGKSTFLKMLAGFIPLNSGEIRWSNSPIQNWEPAKRPVSYLFQSHNLFMHLTIRENIALGIRPNLKLRPDEWAQVDDISNDLGIFDQLAKFPREVSGGQSSRAALARIILQNNDIVLFDEAFSTLGPAQTERIQRIVESKLIENGRLVIFVSHQVADAMDWCDRILWLNGGLIYDPIITKSFVLSPPEGAKAYFGGKLSKY